MVRKKTTKPKYTLTRKGLSPLSNAITRRNIVPTYAQSIVLAWTGLNDKNAKLSLGSIYREAAMNRFPILSRASQLKKALLKLIRDRMIAKVI